MRHYLFQKHHLFFFIILFGIPCKTLAQSVGDYRSVTTGNWSTLETWERLNTLSNSWATPTSAQGYPGQNSMPAAVEIRDDHDITLDESPAYGIGIITIASAAITNTTSTLNIGSQTLRCTTLNINGGIIQNRSEASIGTGTLTVADGITATGSTSNKKLTFSGAGLLQVGGSFVSGLTFTASTGTVEYNGSVAQDVANYAYNILKISGTGTKSLTDDITDSKLNHLMITAGILDTKSFVLRGSALLTMSGGTLKIGLLTTNEAPELGGIFSLTGGTIELNGAGNQKLRGSRTYSSLTFSGSGTKTISSAPDAINGTVTIAESAVLDVASFSFGGANTNLTMSGGRFRSAKLNDIQPSIEGTYTLTGGTVELYGSNATQKQVLRGSRTYYAVELNALAANHTVGEANVNASASFVVQNGLTINSPTVFRFDKMDNVSGNGFFNLKAGATLLYGSPNGIKTSGTTTSDGNIRVAGVRTLPSTASYGFVGNDNMVTGNGLPSTVESLYLEKGQATDVVTLSNALTINTSLNFVSNGKLALSTNDLTVTGSIVGASFSQYILPNSAKSATTGFLIRPVSTTAVDFPIGTSTSYSPVSISNATAANFKARVFDGVYANGTGNALVNDIEEVVKNTWDIAPVSGSHTPDIVFGWNLSQEGSNFTINRNANVNNPKVSANATGTSAKWTTLSSGAVNTSTLFTITATSVPLATYSKFTILGNPFVALPIDLLSFTAKLNNGIAHLEWTTMKEKGNKGFEIERSGDAAEFVKIGFIKADSKLTTFHQYQFLDEDIVGSSYYRLKQVDEDGRFEYSKTVYVKASPLLSFSPNPTAGNVQIRLADEGEAQITLLSMEGKMLFNMTASAQQLSEKLSEVVKNLQPGIYVMQTNQGNTFSRIKLIKQ